MLRMYSSRMLWAYSGSLRYDKGLPKFSCHLLTNLTIFDKWFNIFSESLTGIFSFLRLIVTLMSRCRWLFRLWNWSRILIKIVINAWKTVGIFVYFSRIVYDDMNHTPLALAAISPIGYLDLNQEEPFEGPVITD